MSIQIGDITAVILAGGQGRRLGFVQAEGLLDVENEAQTRYSDQCQS